MFNFYIFIIQVDKYQGVRSHEDLKAYVNRMIGTKSEDKENTIDETKEEPAGIVLVLTGDNFEHGIQKGTAFVKFFAPWYLIHIFNIRTVQI